MHVAVTMMHRTVYLSYSHLLLSIPTDVREEDEHPTYAQEEHGTL